MDTIGGDLNDELVALFCSVFCHYQLEGGDKVSSTLVDGARDTDNG